MASLLKMEVGMSSAFAKAAAVEARQAYEYSFRIVLDSQVSDGDWIALHRAYLAIKAQCAFLPKLESMLEPTPKASLVIHTGAPAARAKVASAPPEID
jgi:hypothetical protein